jgi:hypothetical protein
VTPGRVAVAFPGSPPIQPQSYGQGAGRTGGRAGFSRHAFRVSVAASACTPACACQGVPGYATSLSERSCKERGAARVATPHPHETRCRVCSGRTYTGGGLGGSPLVRPDDEPCVKGSLHFCPEPVRCGHEGLTDASPARVAPGGVVP